MNEATARIKDQPAVGKRWLAILPRRVPDPANVQLEAGVALKRSDLDALGDDFEKTRRGVVDYLLLDERGSPLLVLEAKSEGKQPLVGKEQARRYAKSQKLPFRNPLKW